MESPTMEEEAQDAYFSPYLLISSLLSDYGWYILLGTSALYYIWTTFLKAKFTSHVNDSRINDFNSAQYDAVQDARQKLQNHYDAQAKIHAEKIKEKEEEKAKKRKEMLEKLAKTDGHKLGRSKTTDDSSRSKPKSSISPEGYFPLMGAGGSTSYRSSRPSRARGG